MFCKLKTSSRFYRYFVLFSTCLTMFLRSVFIYGTLQVLSNYYEAKFDNRKLSSMIGPVQVATSYTVALPTLWLSRKVGLRLMQIIAGILPCLGLVGTAFSTQAWHALISNGIITGVGSMCLYTSAFTIMPMYFPKKDQVAPFVVLSVVFGIGTLCTAQTFRFMTKLLGFQYCLVASGIMLLLNVVTGLFYQEPDNSDGSESKSEEQPETLTLRKRPSMIIEIKRRGTFELGKSPLENESIKNKRTYDESGQTETGICDDELANKLAESLQANTDEKAERNGCQERENHLRKMLNHLKNNKLLALVIISGVFGPTGFAVFGSIIADYSIFTLKFSRDDYDIGVTIQGVAQLISGLIYVALAQFFTLSSSGAFTLGIIGQGIAAVLMLFHPSLIQFYMIMVLHGASISLMINSLYPRFLDIVQPNMATFWLLVEYGLEGLTMFLTSLLAAYLQIEVNAYAGFYLTIGIFILGVMLSLPVIIKTMTTPKIYQHNKDDVHITQFTPFGYKWDY